MNKQKIVKAFLWTLNILIILLLVWSLVNYKFLNQEVTQLVQVWGLIAMIFLVVLLEGAPVFMGSGVVVATVYTLGVFNTWFILFLFLVFALVGNVIYYVFGYYSGRKIFKYFSKKDVRRYEKLFDKYGRRAMVVMAVSPIPYLPTLAGVFRMSSPKLIAETLILRTIRHIIVFFFWVFILVRI